MIAYRAPGGLKILVKWPIVPGERQIREGGIGILPHKALKLLALLPFLPFLLIVRLLRPWLILRFAPLPSERIGHFAGNIEVYLCERDAGINVPSRRFVDVFYYNSPICNSQLKRMWDRTLRVCPLDISLADRFNLWLPGGEEHGIPMPHNDRDVHGLLAGTPAHLSFTPDEEEMGRAGLKDLGVPEGTPFVCFHARDSAYLETIYHNFDCSYHDYRDSNIHNYVSAVGELTRRGYYAIRLGSVVKEALNVSNPTIIDYASNGHRTDFMDVYLCGKCKFYLGSGSGPSGLSTIFRVPVAYVNLLPLEYEPRGTRDLFIPKTLWWREGHRFWTFREILDSGAGRFLKTEQFEKLDLEIVENTPEEIMALAVEMDERLKGTWQTTREDEDLQQRFRSLYKPSKLNNGIFLSRIGADFLRQHRDWLE